MKMLAWLAAIAALALALPSAVAGIRPAASSGSKAEPVDGSKLWLRRYKGHANGGDRAHALGVSPDGSKVFVAGQSPSSGSGDDYATVSYDTATGARLWVRAYNGPANGTDNARALAVSPDGTKVIVTGRSKGAGSGFDYATVAYSGS